MSPDRITPEAINLDFLKQEFARLRTELTGMKDKLGGNAAETLEQINAYLGDTGAGIGAGIGARAASLEAELEQLGGKLKDTSKDAVLHLEKRIEEHPLTSIAVAFGVGLLAAQLFRRS